jgi:hypothetical protein
MIHQAVSVKLRWGRWLCGLGLLSVLACGDEDPVRPEDKTLYRVPGDFSVIETAIGHAETGDTILVGPGVWKGSGNRNLVIRGKPLVIVSECGPDSTIIDCERTGRGFVILGYMGQERDGYVLSGFTIRRGGEGGIYCVDAGIRIADCRIERNVAETGGGIFVESSSATIVDCRISNNWSRYQGAGINCEDSGVTVENCVIVSNFGIGGGGIASIDVTTDGPDYLRVKNCTIMGNEITFGVGGGVEVSGGSLEIEACLIAGNVAGSTYAGGIYVANCVGRIASTTIASNLAATFGGAVVVSTGANIALERCIIWNNCSPQSNVLRISPDASARLVCCALDSMGIDARGELEIVGDQVWSDPLFCDPAPCGRRVEGDYSVRIDSPCMPGKSPCAELIGVLDSGCGERVPW